MKLAALSAISLFLLLGLAQAISYPQWGQGQESPAQPQKPTTNTMILDGKGGIDLGIVVSSRTTYGSEPPLLTRPG